MCGIVGLQLLDPQLEPRLGALLNGMLGEVSQRGPDSAGIALYGDDSLTPPGTVSVSVLPPPDAIDAAGALRQVGTVVELAPTFVVSGPPVSGPLVSGPLVSGPLGSGPADLDALAAAVERVLPRALIVGRGERLAVLKAVGHPIDIAARFGIDTRSGWQAVAHTRMATESAVTPAHSHPFSAGDGLCLVHNGSFANHATIRRELQAEGVRFDSDNDSEVAARFVAARLREGDDLEKALRRVCERFDGFYTLLVTTPTSFAVVRDAIACKPALIAQSSGWVAMASEYRALATLPDIDSAQVFEPAPEQVYVWQR